MAKQHETEKNKEKRKEYEGQSLGPDPTLNPALSHQEPMASPSPEISDVQDEHKKSGFQKTVSKPQQHQRPSKKAISPDKAGILHRPSKHGLALGDPIRKPNQDDNDIDG